MVSVGWDQVFAWRLGRQFVAPRSGGAVEEIAGRLVGVQAQVASAAETAVAVRGASVGSVGAALSAGGLVKTWAMRGTLHAMVPEQAAAASALMGSARTWEKPSWVKTFGATPDQVAALVEVVSGVLAEQALTREELVAAVLAEPGFEHLGEQLRSGWGAVLKPLAWQGALCHGPMRGTKITFTAPGNVVPGWAGLPEPDVAAPELIRAYLGAYGPATPETFDAWLSRNSLRKTVVRGWFAALGEELTEVEVEGRKGWLLTEFVDELRSATPDDAIHLLGPFDQYVLGPGTGDTALLPSEHRVKVSRTAGWISPLVLVGGRIAGTWEQQDGQVVVTPFDGVRLPPRALNAAVERLGSAIGNTLTVRIE
ncbi:winged helix DNA-binding domain-containing protein [Nocardia caishijiensis]|uniref:Winged helix DNA-binding protein n=1 Tax=Nocardia caishijiensis TaxID=184756 RepID=A0ABQ6YMF2_9NOCA|nr:winged helix DNA-binding domain-containing protein [Nocardia caishijiensis]KAF0846962.1 winged helix DNA-binding protein [Nocardia caishijiensis]